MSENIRINGAVSEVENEPKKIDMLDFVISSYDDFVHPERKKTSVDTGINIKSSTAAVDVKRASDEMTNVFSVSSENDYVFNENSANSGNLKLIYELDQMFEKIQKLNANLKKSILETHSFVNNNAMMRRGTKEMSKPLPKLALYKTQMCNSWNAHQFCNYGKKCWFAHGNGELRQLPANVSQSVPTTLHKHLHQFIDRVPTSGR